MVLAQLYTMYLYVNIQYTEMDDRPFYFLLNGKGFEEVEAYFQSWLFSWSQEDHSFTMSFIAIMIGCVGRRGQSWSN